MSDPQFEAMRRMWRTALASILLDFRREWLKHPDRRDYIEGSVRRYFRSPDGREVVGNCGWQFGEEAIEQAIAAITAPPKASAFDHGNRWMRNTA